MALATMMDELTTIGGMALGSICTTMMRAGFMPMSRQALTKSASRRRMNSARTRRATVGQEISAMAPTMDATEGLTISTTTMASRKGGTVCTASVRRIKRSSTQPPK
jgi:hypothetical protein